MLEISLLLNIFIFILTTYTLAHIKGKLNILKYYTYLQNLISLIISLFYSICLIVCMINKTDVPEFARGLRYIATCGLLSTMLIYIVFLGNGKKAPITKDDFLKDFSPVLANILLHYVCPTLSLISFIFCERSIIITNGIWTMLVCIPSCLYWIIYIILSSTKAWKEPYNFSSSKSKVWEILTMILIPVSFIVITIILWNIK